MYEGVGVEDGVNGGVDGVNGEVAKSEPDVGEH